jgi:hypothetical protein
MDATEPDGTPNLQSLLYPGALRPIQLVDAPPGVSRGCANLMLRVLQDAIHLLIGRRRGRPRVPGSAERAGNVRARTEAYRWFESDRTDSPFAFATICQVLSLPREGIRTRLGVVALGSGSGTTHALRRDRRAAA